MNTAAEFSSMQPLVFSSRRFGASGLLVAVIGLIVALICPLIEDTTHPPPRDLSHVLTETATQIKDKLTRPEVTVEAQRQLSIKRVTKIFSALIGFVGAALGTASWVRREDTRLAGVAVAVGLASIAWNFFLFAILAAMGLFLLAWILSQFE
jgi:hypothetical protein